VSERRALDDSVVVITGASSGIGLATALYWAEHGASLVLGARRGDVVEELAETCRAVGAEALARPLDVSDADSVASLAAAAVERFGRIDVWINNAGVYSVGLFEDTPPDVFERLIAVNLLGVVSGSREAVRQFRAQGGTGTLINVSSMIGGLAGPYVSAYATSKWGVRGLSFALREELRDTPGIEVCVVRPASIDTPIFRHSANFSGRALQALTPTYPAEQAAHTIANLVEHPRREVVIGQSGKALELAHVLAPGLVDRIFGSRATRNQFAGDQPAEATTGNVFDPDPAWTTASGNWPTVNRKRRALVLPLAAAVTATAVLATRRAVFHRS
jgi:NAD(P)-dependent dehydrogenase (short-subunit alcohol dehydrogenase family)